MKNKGYKSISLILIVCTLLTTVFYSGCKQTKDNLTVGSDIALLKNIELDYENAFFDDFIGGVSYDSWYINKMAWGKGNGGVIPENVNYTDEGVLVLSGNGEFYTDGDVRGVGARKDGTLTGACLSSKFVTGPGRYQIKMKVLPRLGACSAFWVYSYEDGRNHEIDIELPGGKSSSMISFENVLNTNYITPNMNDSQDKAIIDANLDCVALNDGEWHTFGFDWYTMESGESAKLLGEDVNMGKVVYYIDGKVTAVSDFFIPYYQTRLWLGVWFPNNESFVGTANFESDCMYVDWVEYIPFKNQPFVEYEPELGEDEVADKSEYPTSPVATTTINKIANGDFEYIRKGVDNGGFQIKQSSIPASERIVIKEKFKNEILLENPNIDSDILNQMVENRFNEYYDLPVTEFYSIANNVGYQNSCGATIRDYAYVRQVIDSVYAGFNSSVYFYAKGKGKLILSFMEAGQKSRNNALKQLVIEVDNDGWQKYTGSMIAPKGTKEIWVDFLTGYDCLLSIDNISLKFI